MTTADKIIEKFGGQTALANLIGKRQSTVQYWAKCGTIPAKWHGKLLHLAAENHVNLVPSDFIENNQHEITVESKENKLPVAMFFGDLTVTGDGAKVPCYVLDDGRRVISRTGATDMLTDGKGGGNLESYIGVKALENYIPTNFHGDMIEFSIKEVVNKTVLGLEAESFLDICKAYAIARDKGDLKTDRQIAIAKKATMFLAACSKIGLIALIDEVTGYQYEREEDALQFKLKLFLEDEMRPWEKTFPDELWLEFGRLTNWNGSIHQRPKYWGKLVMELIYGYLDKDVAEWLKTNAPKPRGGQNYHRWLSSQYGLKKLIEHIWMVIGMAKACLTMSELRERMALQFGRGMVQLSLFLPNPATK